MPTASQSRAYWDRLLRPILDAVGDSRSRPCLTGLHGGTTGFALTLLADQAPNKSWLIVTGSDEAAERLYEDLQFFHAMLSRGVALAPGPYEAIFPSLAHTEADLTRTVEAAAEAALELARGPLR